MPSTPKPFRSPLAITLAGLALALPAPAMADANGPAAPLTGSVAWAGIPADYVAALQAIVGEVSAREASRLWEAGVTPADAGAYRGLFASLDADELASLHRMALSPDEVRAYQRAGIADAATIIRLRRQQVTPKMARHYGADSFMKRPFETMNPEPGPW